MKSLALFWVVAFVVSCTDAVKEHKAEPAYALLEKVWERNSHGDKQAALLLADSALAMDAADSTRCWLMCEKTVALLDMGRIADAISVGREARRYAEKTGDDEAILNLHGTLGIAYRRKGQPDSAIIEYKKGIEYALKQRNTEYEIYLDNCISVLYSENNRFAEAFDYASKAEHAALAANDTIERLSARANIGGIFLRQKQYRKALDAVLPFWDTVLAVDYKPLTLKYLSVILKSYAVSADTAALERYMPYAEQAMQGMSTTNIGVLGIVETKAYLLGRKHRYNEQLALLDSLLSTSHLMPEEKLLAEKASCLSALGRKSEAFDCMYRAYAMLDSVKESDIERSMSEFTVKYRTLEKDMALEQARREKAEAHRLIAALIAVVSVLAAVVVLLLYHRKVAAQKAELQEKQNFISGMETERERIARELHDGVCNDILATTMLLAVDSQKGEKQLRDIWREVRHLSHALMPPRFTGVTLPDAVRSFVAMLTDDDRCKVDLSVDDKFDWHSLPRQTAYETYRIIQEALGNAVRYGSETSPVCVSLVSDSRLFSATVTNAIPEETVDVLQSSGAGTDTMRKRANTIGARLTTTVDHDTYTVRLSFDKPGKS